MKLLNKLPWILFAISVLVLIIGQWLPKQYDQIDVKIFSTIFFAGLLAICINQIVWRKK